MKKTKISTRMARSNSARQNLGKTGTLTKSYERLFSTRLSARPRTNAKLNIQSELKLKAKRESFMTTATSRMK